MVNTDIVIVGAGPAGALLGLLLAKKGFRVALVEQHSDVAREFRGEHLNEEGEKVLKKTSSFFKNRKAWAFKDGSH
ncbi:FAD-dependent oxidoreductase [Ureibacillus sp. FSL K6-8385]|mgnify:CR=1 FL=1|uniref:FAD-dependent oxidoreductase n=1 Tax=Ureibacillus TaxID=160795 RepID=UPI002E1B702C